MKYIPLKDCQEGHLYILYARNAALGIFDKETQGFILLRNKMGREYAFTEAHWDTGRPYGTARPLEDLGEAPRFIDPEEFKRFMKNHPERVRARTLYVNAFETTLRVVLPPSLRKKLMAGYES